MFTLAAIFTIMLWGGTSCALIFSAEFLSLLFKFNKMSFSEWQEYTGDSPAYWRRLAIFSTLIAIAGDIGLLIVLS
jgi:hypothetical protein